MNRIAAAVALATGLVLSGCTDSGEPDPKTTVNQGDLVFNVPDAWDSYYELYRLCEGTTAIYTFKDYTGWDFQIVLDDPKCVVAK